MEKIKTVKNTIKIESINLKMGFMPEEGKQNLVWMT